MCRRARLWVMDVYMCQKKRWWSRMCRLKTRVFFVNYFNVGNLGLWVRRTSPGDEYQERSGWREHSSVNTARWRWSARTGWSQYRFVIPDAHRRRTFMSLKYSAMVLRMIFRHLDVTYQAGEISGSKQLTGTWVYWLTANRFIILRIPKDLRKDCGISL